MRGRGHRFQRLHGYWAAHIAVSSQLCAGMCTLQHFEPKFFLQGIDGMAGGRLGVIHSAGGTGNIVEFRNFEKKPIFVDFHINHLFMSGYEKNR